MWARLFAQEGGRLVARGDESDRVDIVILNSCTVTAEAARKSRQRVRRQRRDHPDAFLVLTGCYSAVAPREELDALPVDLEVSNQDKERLVEQVLAAYRAATQRREPLEEPSSTPLLKPDAQPALSQASHEALPQTSSQARSSYLSRGMQRAFVKIQDGCRYRCAYCIVTIARGEERSRPMDQLLKEIAEIEEAGINEIVLTGVQIGGYGADLGTSLEELLETLLAQTQIPRIRLSSLEPWSLSDKLLDLLAHPKVQPHLHLPLQSGSDSVLRRMSRRGSADQFRTILNRYHQRVPQGVVTTDIIAGFPAESEAEWEATHSLIANSSIGWVHCFPFSVREGTRAATLPNPLPHSIIRERCNQMNRLSRQLLARTASRFVETRAQVLWEQRRQSPTKGEYEWHGLTPQFLKVTMRTEEQRNRVGELEEVELNRFDMEKESWQASLITSPF
jgi:threonylcarbamoyladenosine tRNA methylthiotransferase MtaB